MFEGAAGPKPPIWRYKKACAGARTARASPRAGCCVMGSWSGGGEDMAVRIYASKWAAISAV